MRWILAFTLFIPVLLADFITQEHPILWIHDKRIHFKFASDSDQIGDQRVHQHKNKLNDQNFLDESIILLPLLSWGPERRNELHSSYLLPPSSENILGTDSNGRDLFSRILFATRGSLIFLAALFLIQIGGAVSLASFSSLNIRKNRWVLNTITDCFESIPIFVFIMFLTLTFEMTHLLLGLVFGVLTWPKYYQIAVAEMSKQMLSPSYEALKAAGADSFYISTRWLIPSALSRIVPLSISAFAQALVWVSTADFFGFGLPAPTPTFGQMLSDGLSHSHSAWWLIVFPTAALLVITLSSYFLSKAFLKHSIVE